MILCYFVVATLLLGGIPPANARYVHIDGKTYDGEYLSSEFRAFGQMVMGLADNDADRPPNNKDNPAKCLYFVDHLYHRMTKYCHWSPTVYHSRFQNVTMFISSFTTAVELSDSRFRMYEPMFWRWESRSQSAHCTALSTCHPQYLLVPGLVMSSAASGRDSFYIVNGSLSHAYLRNPNHLSYYNTSSCKFIEAGSVHVVAVCGSHMYWTDSRKLYKYDTSQNACKSQVTEPSVAATLLAVDLDLPHVRSIVCGPKDEIYLCTEIGAWEIKNRAIHPLHISDECSGMAFDGDNFYYHNGDDLYYYKRVIPTTEATTTTKMTTTIATTKTVTNATTTSNATTASTSNENTATSSTRPPVTKKEMRRQEPSLFSKYLLPHILAGCLMVLVVLMLLAIGLFRGWRDRWPTLVA